MAFNRANQPSFNLFTGVEESPPQKEPLRQTFRNTLRTSTMTNAPHTVVPDNPVNEDLRAQLNTLRYELETAKQEKAMLKVELDQEIRDAQSRAETEFRKAQQAETANAQTAKRHEALSKEMTEVRTRAENERRDLERRLRQSQEKAQSLQEDYDEAKEDLASSQRQSEHRYNNLHAEHSPTWCLRSMRCRRRRRSWENGKRRSDSLRRKSCD